MSFSHLNTSEPGELSGTGMLTLQVTQRGLGKISTPLPCFSQRGGLVCLGHMLFTFGARRKENMPSVKGRGVHKATGNFAN